MENRKRSIAKTITFRILATITTVVLVLIFTKDLSIAGIVGVLDFLSKLLIYYLHERAWDKIRWGVRSS